MTLEEQVVKKLKERDMIIATAESCSGGLLAARILNVAGASGVFSEGYITYSNDAKRKLLEVTKDTLDRYGAVSEETAEQMARGMAKASEASVTLSITGVAGPDGGTAKKPVGLVYIGCFILEEVVVKEYRFSGTREENRQKSVQCALELVNQLL